MPCDEGAAHGTVLGSGQSRVRGRRGYEMGVLWGSLSSSPSHPPPSSSPTWPTLSKADLFW